MALAFDNTLVREPGLLVPGRMPIAKPYINWGHPLTHGLQLVLLPSVSSRSLVHGWEVTEFGNLPVVTREDGRAKNTIGANGTSLDCGWRLHKNGSAVAVMGGSFSLFFDLTPTGVYDSDGRNTFFDSRDSSYGAGYTMLQNDGGSTLEFTIDKGLSLDQTKVTGVITTGKRHILGVSHNIVTGRSILFCNGEVLSDRVNTPGNFQNEQSGIALARRWYFSTARGTSLDNFYGYVRSVIGYARAVTKDEGVALTRDPYQFLIPAE